MSLCNGQNSSFLIPASTYALGISVNDKLVSCRVQMRSIDSIQPKIIRGWFEIGEQSDEDRLLPEQGAAANPYPLRS